MIKPNKIEVAGEYVKRFPKSNNSVLARLIYMENKPLYLSVEDARTCVRKFNGAHGKKSQKVRPKNCKSNGVAIPFLPEASKEVANMSPFEIHGDCKALIISDVHVPFYDREALKIAVEYGVKEGVNTVIINGDFVDNYATSSWMTDPRIRDFKGEIEKCKQVLVWIRCNFPSARIIFKFGNHDERLELFLMRKAPELLGIDCLTLDNLLDFEALKIEPVKNSRVIKMGLLNIIHGHEYRFAISNPVNPARGLFLRAKSISICGHFHQTSNHTEKTLDNKAISTWSTGCLCAMNPVYRPYNNWNHGFAIVDYKGGQFSVDNKRIIGGKVY